LTDPLRPLLLGMGWPSAQAGGLNRYFADLVAALEAIGAEPTAVVVGPAPGAPSNVLAAGESNSSLPTRMWQFARAAARPAEVADAHFALYALFPTLRHPRRPLVVHFHGPWADESRATGERAALRLGLKRRVERTVYRRATRAVTLSGAFKRLLVERYGVDPWRIDVVPPGVDLERFRPGSAATARERLGLPVDAWIALSVRRLVPRMGLDVLIDAWAQFVVENPAALLVLVGEGPERDRLESQVAELQLTNSVRFLGRVADGALADCYRAADVCVVPSLALEGFGLVVLESLACGTPIVTSDVGGLPEAVSELQPDLVVPAGDVSALVQRLLDAASGWRPLPQRDACRALAERFSWRDAARTHLDIYADAIRPPAKRRARVVYLGHTARLSGGELALLRLLPALSEVDAHVILAEDGPLVERLIRVGISVEVLPLGERTRDLHRAEIEPGRRLVMPALASALYAARLARRLRRLEPDLVHTNSLKAALYGGLAGRMAGVPVIWHIRDRIADDYLPSTSVRLVHRLARTLPTALIANSQTTLRTFGGSRPTAAVTMPSPVVLNDPVSPMARGGSARTDGGLRVGMVGRIASWKGQHVFLEAFARAFPHGKERAVVVGSPLFGEHEYEGELHELVDRLGISERVEFIGFQEDVAAELATFDILVHASTIPEPFGQVVLEGLAAGKAVLAAGAGGPTEIITDGEDGLLYEPGDVDALAAALVALGADPELRERLGRAGVVRSQDFAPDAIAAELTEFYGRILRLPRG
jgi:glycosyltransferase involved in cell wall biosynthesis